MRVVFRFLALCSGALVVTSSSFCTTRLKNAMGVPLAMASLSLVNWSHGAPVGVVGNHAGNLQLAAPFVPESSILVTSTTSRSPLAVVCRTGPVAFATKAIMSTICPLAHCNNVARSCGGAAWLGIFTVLWSTGWKVEVFMSMRTLHEQPKYLGSCFAKDTLDTFHTVPFLYFVTACL